MGLFEKKPRVLMDCVFCGGKPRLARCGDQKEFFIYQCSCCYETPVMFHEARLCEFGARKIWNERTEAARHIISIYNWVKGHITEIMSSEEAI
jgi:hypothetical protein